MFAELVIYDIPVKQFYLYCEITIFDKCFTIHIPENIASAEPLYFIKNPITL